MSQAEQDAPPCMRMDRYWNYIAIPYFLSTLLFGLYAIFSVSGPTTSDSRSVMKLVEKIVADRKKSGQASDASL